MTAPHFFAPDVEGDRILLRGEEARHATRVLRIRPGEEVTVSDGEGRVARGKVVEAGAELVVEVTDRADEPAERPAVHVFQAIPKAGKLDLVVQKLTELGVAIIQPFPAARSVARWEARKARAQTERLAAIAREAAKQARRAWLPEVRAPAPLAAIELPDPTFLLHEEADLSFRQVLPPGTPHTIGIVVGPEGGFEQEEVGSLRDRGAVPVTLGRLILRTETAAFVAVTVIGVRYGRLG